MYDVNGGRRGFRCDVTLHPGAAFITPVKRQLCRIFFGRSAVGSQQAASQFKRCIEHVCLM